MLLFFWSLYLCVMVRVILNFLSGVIQYLLARFSSYLSEEQDYGEKCLFMSTHTLLVQLMVISCSSYMIFLVWDHLWRFLVGEHWKLKITVTFDRLLMLCIIMLPLHLAYCNNLMWPQKFSTFGSKCCKKPKRVELGLILKGIIYMHARLPAVLRAKMIS